MSLSKTKSMGKMPDQSQRLGDGKNIGSASNVYALTIRSDENITLLQDREIQDAGTILQFISTDDMDLTHEADTGQLLK